MATAIEIKYCRHCGQLENMHSTMDCVRDVNVIEVWCPCGAELARTIELGATQPYYLKVETRMEEASGNDGDDQGDVLAQHEQEAEGL